MLIALPVPSTGFVAMSPSLNPAIAPFANESAGATAPPADGLAVPLALALAEADGLALADGLGPNRCLPNADCDSDVECDPCETAMMTPRVTPNATVMARGTAIRAVRLRRVRRRIAGRCPVSI